MMQRLYVGLAALVLVASAQAQIYKWTDENGKVHYSDKKVAETAQAQNVDLGTMPAVRSVSALTPNAYTGNLPSRFALFYEPQFYSAPAVLQQSKPVNLYFGGDCVSPTSLKFEEFVQRYRSNLPKPHYFYNDVSSILGKHGYNTLIYTSSTSKTNVQNLQPVHLRVEFLDIKINACAKDLYRAVQAASLDNFDFSDFNKANAWLRLRWTITDSADQRVLLTTETEGAADKIDGRDIKIYEAMMAAYRQAITNFLAHPQVTKVWEPVLPAVVAAPAAEEPSLLSGLRDRLMGSSVKKSQVAEALSMVSPLRMLVMEYYSSNDQWPVHVSQVDLAPEELREPDLVDGVELRAQGVIHINLAASEFGAGQYLQLIPRPAMSGMQISWDCRTNLDKAYWVGDCVGL